MHKFIVLRSILLILILYIAFIINNSLAQIFQSNRLLYILLLSVILAELFSYLYTLIFSQSHDLFVFGVNEIGALFSLTLFPFILNYFIIFVALLFYSFLISLISVYFSIEDRSDICWSSDDLTNSNFRLSEKKGLFYSYYTIDLYLPLGFLSLEDKRNYYDLIKNNEAIIEYSLTHDCNFSFHAKGCKFFSTTRLRILALANDIEQLSKNMAIE